MTISEILTKTTCQGQKIRQQNFRSLAKETYYYTYICLYQRTRRTRKQKSFPV